MSRRLIPVLMVTIAASMLASASVCLAGEPVFTEKTPVEPVKPLTLVTDEAAAEKLVQAKNLMKSDYAKGRVLLQELLDAKDDPLVKVQRGVKAGVVTWEYTHVSEEAAYIIWEAGTKNTKPDEPKAKELLAKAQASKLREDYAAVSKRYPYTKSAHAAENELATSYAEAGDYMTAALWYRRFYELRALKDWSGQSLFHAYAAFRRAGLKEEAESTADQLFLFLKDNALTIDGRKITGDNADKEIEKCLQKLDNPVETMSLQGGSLRRTTQSVGGTPDLGKRDWQLETVRSPIVRDLLATLGEKHLVDRQPMLPAAFAISALVRRQADATVPPVPEVIFRSQLGVHALDSRTGKLMWEADMDWSPDKIAKTSAQRWNVLKTALEGAVKDNRNHLLWDNSLVGSMSCDARAVYVIDDLHALPAYDLTKCDDLGFPLPQIGDPLLGEALLYNRLKAYDIKNGKYLWYLGGRRGEKAFTGPAELLGGYFLGAPLPLGDKLYMLTECDRVVRVVCVDKASPGIIDWQLTLGKAGTSLIHQPNRRMHAAQIAYDDGILVCQTNTGAVFGVDPLTRLMLWTNIYRDKEETLPGKPNIANPTPPELHWKNSPPMIQHGKVIVAPPDADTLYCLSLRDGSVLWQVPRADEDLYVAGIFDGKVIVVSTNSVKAYNLDDGKKAWKELETGMPSGQGVAAKNVYYLPLRYAGEKPAESQAEICTIDITKGKIKSHIACAKDDVPGNLLFFNGQLLSQGSLDIKAYALK